MPLRESVTDWFSKKKKKKELEYQVEKLDIPGDLWVKCYKCGDTLYYKDLEKNFKVCTKCGYHFKLSFRERIAITVDNGAFVEYDKDIRSTNFFNFTDSKSYTDRLEDNMKNTGLSDAIVTGEGKLSGHPVVIGVMDFSFMGGSMGSAVGEKVTLAVERAIEKKMPVVIFNASGGARMQEGIMSLMQMAKTSAAIAKLSDRKLPYISVLTDPTTAGVSASYAMLGDIIISEPNALVGFAGPRVIEQTIKQKLPPGFQRAEYVQQHGMIDIVTERKYLKDILIKIVEFCGF